ncbi:MAG: hypothetical protein R2798_08750 [Chitinophagales bacterium]|nr:hypothetical protein [Bacteroidota bacterium]MCB9043958.1 hypothetical protein [Chitinophagales bacterium]
MKKIISIGVVKLLVVILLAGVSFQSSGCAKYGCPGIEKANLQEGEMPKVSKTKSGLLPSNGKKYNRKNGKKLRK